MYYAETASTLADGFYKYGLRPQLLPTKIILRTSYRPGLSLLAKVLKLIRARCYRSTSAFVRGRGHSSTIDAGQLCRSCDLRDCHRKTAKYFIHTIHILGYMCMQ